jgi:hypothetical protein
MLPPVAGELAWTPESVVSTYSVDLWRDCVTATPWRASEAGLSAVSAPVPPT